MLIAENGTLLTDRNNYFTENGINRWLSRFPKPEVIFELTSNIPDTVF